MRIWAISFVIVLAWTVMSMLFWFNSLRNLTMLSLVALILACGAGFQASLSMRKSDDNDDF